MLTRISFKKKKWILARKKIGHYLGRKPRCCLGRKVGFYSGRKKIEVILEVIKDAI